MRNFLKIYKLKQTIDEITIYASALSFYTIFSLIPILLLIFAIFSNTPFFNEYYSKLQEFIFSIIAPTNKEIVKTYIDNFLTNSYKLGIIGGGYLVIASILFFDNYETILSKIFKKEKRDLIEKIKLYWTMITLLPILFSFAIYFSIKAQIIVNTSFFLPFVFVFLSFFSAYALTIYEKNIKNIAISSFIVTFLFLIAKKVFIYYVLLNKTYSSIYGSISILAFLFLWIYISWIIYIFGLYLIKFLDIILKKGENNESKQN